MRLKLKRDISVEVRSEKRELRRMKSVADRGGPCRREEKLGEEEGREYAMRGRGLFRCRAP
jgi:hypothetical protein